MSEDGILKERYELLHSSRKRYKSLRVQLVAANHQWQMDLADLKYLERYNSGLRYLLVVIDIYSRYLWVKRLRNKNSDLFARNLLRFWTMKGKLGILMFLQNICNMIEGGGVCVFGEK